MSVTRRDADLSVRRVSGVAGVEKIPSSFLFNKRGEDSRERLRKLSLL